VPLSRLLSLQQITAAQDRYDPFGGSTTPFFGDPAIAGG